MATQRTVDGTLAVAGSLPKPPPVAESSSAHYKGFVAGVFSGVAKLSVGHPFDTIKVRMQTTSAERFAGPMSCLVQTIRNEGVRALYKGATPPLVGWMFMDSVMLGSLTMYKKLLGKYAITSGEKYGTALPADHLPHIYRIHMKREQNPHFINFAVNFHVLRMVH